MYVLATVLERLRGVGAAAGRAVTRYHIAEALVTAAGGAVGVKVSDYLKTNKTTVKLYQSLKEWGDFVIGFAIPIVYELAKERFRGVPYLDQFIYGMSAVLMSNTLSVVMGAPFAIILDNGELYTKNISPKDNTFLVLVDGNANAYDAQNKTWANDIPEGAHDIVVVGAKKGKYFKQYTPAITGTGGGGGAATLRTATTAK